MTVWKGWCRVAGGEKGSPRPPPRPSVPQSIRASEAACPHVMMTNMPVSRALSGFDNLAFQLRRLTFKVRLKGKTWNSQLQTVRRRWYLQVEGKKKKLTTGSICHLTTIKTFFSKQDIFVKVLRSPKIRYRAEGVSLKAGKKKSLRFASSQRMIAAIILNSVHRVEVSHKICSKKEREGGWEGSESSNSGLYRKRLKFSSPGVFYCIANTALAKTKNKCSLI